MTTAEPSADRVRRFEEDILVYFGELYRVALRLTGRPADAEDLVQDTCLRAFRALDQLRHAGAAKVWLFTILRSVFLRQAEREPTARARVSLDDIDLSVLATSEALHEVDEGGPGSRPILQHETREAILRLPLAYREPVMLAHIGGFSYREMAHILGVPMGTVMSRLFRGRRILRSYYGAKQGARHGAESRRAPLAAPATPRRPTACDASPDANAEEADSCLIPRTVA